MNTQTILLTAKVLHFIALAMAAGITIANYAAFKQFWKLYEVSKEQGLAALRASTRYQVVGMSGLLLLVLSGLTMLFLLQWTLVSLLWFQIKLGLVVLIFVNGFSRGRSQTLKMRALLGDDKAAAEKIEINSLKSTQQTFQITQLILFVLIVICSVFKFV